MALGSARWMAGLARRLAPPAQGSDAELLDRYVATREALAFTLIYERHAGAVRAVCRARLGDGADADDAFQIVFYVLARDAGKIRQREMLAGWLVRTAQLTALKMRRTYARKRTLALPTDVATPTEFPHVETDEERAIVAEELAEMPEKLRTVLVLCSLEERTNTAAAEILGCPRGTVDSRLATAKTRLRQRLLQRGIALTTLVTIETQLFRLAAATAPSALTDATLFHALEYGEGSLGATTLTTLADGVTTTMSHTTRLVLAGLVASGVMTTAGFGLYHGHAEGAPQAAKAAPPPKAEPPKPPQEKLDAKDEKGKPLASDVEVRHMLKEVVDRDFEGSTFRELATHLQTVYNITLRFDVAGYKRLSASNDGGDLTIENIKEFYDRKLVFFNSKGLTISELLNEAVAQIPVNSAYRIRNNQIIIGPAYQPAAIPNRTNQDDAQIVSHKQLLEQIMGEPVSLSVVTQPLETVIQELRQLTGANIVVNDTKQRELPSKITATFDDVRLHTALEVIGDMADLKLVVLNNVYYLTTHEKAEALQKKINRELFGKADDSPSISLPPGHVTDGVDIFVNPGNLMRPGMGLGGGLGGGGGGGLGSGGGRIMPKAVPAAPADAPKPMEKK
jgi:RNA polymerase sigma factor (sigma-70 family)